MIPKILKLWEKSFNAQLHQPFLKLCDKNLVLVAWKDMGRGRPLIRKELSFKLRHQKYGIRALVINYGND